MHGGAYLRGSYTWSETSGKEKEGLSAKEGGGLIGREIQYAVQSHFQIQSIKKYTCIE